MTPKTADRIEVVDALRGVAFTSRKTICETFSKRFV